LRGAWPTPVEASLRPAFEPEMLAVVNDMDADPPVARERETLRAYATNLGTA
jgi:hypothetical protein